MFKKTMITVGAGAVLVGLQMAPLQAKEGSLGSLKAVGGTVELRSPGGSWRAVSDGSALFEGDVVRTGESGAIAKLGSGVTVRASAATEFTVLQDKASSQVLLSHGRLLGSCEKKELRVTTELGSRLVANQGTFSVVSDKDATSFKVLTGSAQLSGSDLKASNFPALGGVDAVDATAGMEFSDFRELAAAEAGMYKVLLRDGTTFVAKSRTIGEIVDFDADSVTIRLSDGSTVELQTTSKTEVDWSDSLERAELRKGAKVEVFSDASGSKLAAVKILMDRDDPIVGGDDTAGYIAGGVGLIIGLIFLLAPATP